MFRGYFFTLLIIFSISAFAQNDLDAIRYSRLGVGGTSRFVAMGGAFGALGADLSAASYNPAGLGLFRKGEISFSAGFRGTNNTGVLYNKNTSVADAAITFNNFGLAVALHPEKDPDSRHVLAFSNSQLVNFTNSTRMSAYTNSNSIGKDMLNLANQYQSHGNDITLNLNPSYEGLGFSTFLLDTAYGQFYSLIDLKRSVKQTRDIVTSGRVNDINLSYAYALQDKFYFGASIGFPQVKYESTITHTEADDKDSMMVTFTSDSTYTDTYVDGLPVAYKSKLGFNSLTYEEYFKTTGSGINLKLGGIMRLSDMVRLGFYYHTPTFYNLQDAYYSSMSASFDKSPSKPVEWTEPENGGIFKYKIVTPSKISANVGLIFKKSGIIGVDYEYVNYRNAQLGSSNVSDFAGVNAVIKTKYSGGHNIRVGAEMNLNPIMVRVGYYMQGSPFGDIFSGSFVRNTFSIGAGFRTKSNFYFDFTASKTFSQEDYFLFTTLNTQGTLKYNSVQISATIGVKF
jgi:hypothetical protein